MLKTIIIIIIIIIIINSRNINISTIIINTISFDRSGNSVMKLCE